MFERDKKRSGACSWLQGLSFRQQRQALRESHGVSEGVAAGALAALRYVCPRLGICGVSRREDARELLWAEWAPCWDVGSGGTAENAAVLVSKTPMLDVMLLERMALGSTSHHALVTRHPFYISSKRYRDISVPHTSTPGALASMALTTWAAVWGWTLDALSGGIEGRNAALSFAVVRVEDMVAEEVTDGVQSALRSWLLQSCAPLGEWKVESGSQAGGRRGRCHAYSGARRGPRGNATALQRSGVARAQRRSRRMLLELHHKNSQKRDLASLQRVADDCAGDADCARLLKALTPALAAFGYSATGSYVAHEVERPPLLFVSSNVTGVQRARHLLAAREALHEALRIIFHGVDPQRPYPGGWCAPSPAPFCAGAANGTLKGEVGLC